MPAATAAPQEIQPANSEAPVERRQAMTLLGLIGAGAGTATVIEILDPSAAGATGDYDRYDRDDHDRYQRDHDREEYDRHDKKPEDNKHEHKPTTTTTCPPKQTTTTTHPPTTTSTTPSTTTSSTTPSTTSSTLPGSTTLPTAPPSTIHETPSSTVVGRPQVVETTTTIEAQPPKKHTEQELARTGIETQDLVGAAMASLILGSTAIIVAARRRLSRP